MSPISPRVNNVFYAIVLHNFVAERTDELDAKAGDSISVVAHSNHEWFVAKPIGRLGRPGLIPASFVEVRDPITSQLVDVAALIQRGDLPTIEDWKKAMISYKQNSIALGVIDDAGSPVSNSPFVAAKLPSSLVLSKPQPSPPLPPIPLPEGILLSASVISFHYEVHYWFQIHAIFQPYGPQPLDELPKAKRLVLFRQYEDFYAFQVKLLDAFPQEAGHDGPGPRILPFMPGQVEEVNDEVTEKRREELDVYLRRLCELNLMGATYILEDELTRRFLAPGPGDIENSIDPQYEEIRIIFPDGESSEVAVAEEDDYSVPQGHAHRMSGGKRSSERDDRRDPAHAHHQRSRTVSSVRHHDEQTVHHHHAPATAFPDAHHTNGASRGSFSSGSQLPDHTSQSSSVHSSQPSWRPRTHSKASVNPSAPSISADNPAPAFLKIKIHGPTDIYAIRLNPNASLRALKKKVSEKLDQGRYALFVDPHRTSELLDDDDLDRWKRSTDKLSLWVQ